MYKKLLFILLFLILLIVSVFIDSHFIEPDLLIVRKNTLYLPNWDKKIDGFKIAVISDLHIGSKNVDLNKVKKIAKIVNKNNPDLVVFLGDFDSFLIQKTKYKMEELVSVFKNFKAANGVISVLGNHDYASPSPAFIKEFLNEANIDILENNSIHIFPNGRILKITGLKDLWYFPNIKPKETIGPIYSPTIVLMHNPDSFPSIPGDVSLTLSGHTHGGEIVFPFFGSPIVPSEYGQRYRKGHIVENGKHLYVSAGVASLSGFRFLNPPEISILTLYSQTSKTKIINTKPKTGFTKKHWRACINWLIHLKKL